MRRRTCGSKPPRRPGAGPIGSCRFMRRSPRFSSQCIHPSTHPWTDRSSIYCIHDEHTRGSVLDGRDARSRSRSILACGGRLGRDVHGHLHVRRGERADRRLEGSLDARRPVPRHRRRGRAGHARRRRGGPRSGRCRGLSRSRDDGRDQRPHHPWRGTRRPHHHRGLSRPPGDRAPEAARPLRPLRREAANADPAGAAP